MLIDFIATVAAGFGMAGLVLGLRWPLRRFAGVVLPLWALPAFVGLAMLATAVAREYGWYRENTRGHPELVVASAPVERAWYRPWTYVAPLTLRFVAVDRDGILRSNADPSLIVAPVLIHERWAPTRQITVAFDCAGHRRAELLAGAELNDDGTLTGVEWRAVGPEDALVKAACNGG